MKLSDTPRGNLGRYSLACTIFLFLVLIIPFAVSVRAQTSWFCLQQGNVRSGPDTTVSSNGVLVTTDYITGGTYIQASHPANNYLFDTNLAEGTYQFPPDTNRILLSFDLTPVYNAMGGNAYSILGANLVLTHRTAGGGGNGGQALWVTTPFNQTNATWNSPGNGAPAGGTLATLVVNQGMIGTSTYPTTETYNNANLASAIANTIANSTNKTVYLMVKRNSETVAPFYNLFVTQTNSDATYGGIFGRPQLQVQVSVLSNAPLASVAATVPNANEHGPQNATFTITRAINTTNTVTINYSFGGTAIYGVDYTASQLGSVTLAPGVVSTNIDIIPMDNGQPKDIETVVLTIASNPSYGVGVSSATAAITPNNDANALVQYMFGYLGQGAQVWDTNLSVSAITSPTFSLPWQYSSINLSTPSSLILASSIAGNSEAQSVLRSNYISFMVSPGFGAAATYTNLEFSDYYYNPDDLNAFQAVVVVRSSLDNFTSDLGAVTNLADNLDGGWKTFDLPLGASFSNVLGQVEFRLYAFDDATSLNAGLRIDNLYLDGSTDPLSSEMQQVIITASISNAVDSPLQSGALTLASSTTEAAPLDIYYAISGTASNGVDYQVLSGIATIPVGTNKVVIAVDPIHSDLIQGDKTVTLTVITTNAYGVYGNPSATVTISDGNKPTQAAVVVNDNNANERSSLLTGAFTIIRLGATNSDTTVNFNLGGSAVLGVDYLCSATDSITVPAGQMGRTIIITPLNPNITNGTKTVTLTLAGGVGYQLVSGSVTNGTVVIYHYAADLPGETVLWADSFDAGTSSSNNYTITEGERTGPPDYTADFAFNYLSAGIPLALGAVNGNGLRLTVNKNDSTAAAAAVNCFPSDRSFSNNFALRLNLHLSYSFNFRDNPLATDGEVALLGINQSGTNTDWYCQSPITSTNGDGLWLALAVNDQDLPTVQLWGSTNLGQAPVPLASCSQASLAQVFNSPPFGVPGGIGNPVYSTNQQWLDVDLSQVANVITLKINSTILLQYTNTTSYTNGNIMLGYNDPFNSIGSTNAFAVFENVRVVGLPAVVSSQPIVQSITVSNANVVINFTGSVSDSAGSFTVQSSAAVPGQYQDVSASIVATGTGAFQAVMPANGSQQFYRIRRN